MPRPSCDPNVINLGHSFLLSVDNAANRHVYARPAAVRVDDARTSTRLETACNSEKSASVHR